MAKDLEPTKEPTQKEDRENGPVEDEMEEPRGRAPEKGETVADFFSLHEVFRRVMATAHEELSRPNRLLFWSGLTGGLVIGFSLLARASVMAKAPGQSELVGNLLYPIGFIILILGRYQLFTENTLTPVTLVLTRLASLRNLLRLWTVVFLANMVGTMLFALFLGPFQVMSPEATELAIGFGVHLVSATWLSAFAKAILAGALMATIVWLVHAARAMIARIVIIWLLIYLQVTGELFHSVVGALEVQYSMFQGAVTLGSYLWDFQIPVTLGNIVGGVVFVAILNYIQLPDADETKTQLTMREWFLGRRE